MSASEAVSADWAAQPAFGVTMLIAAIHHAIEAASGGNVVRWVMAVVIEAVEAEIAADELLAVDESPTDS